MCFPEKIFPESKDGMALKKQTYAKYDMLVLYEFCFL